MGITSYRELDVWREGMELVKRVYRVSRTLPADERYGLTAQMQRAAVSVPSNIAEGWARRGSKLYLRHVSIARGSLAELETQLLICVDLGYVSADRLADLLDFIDTLGRRLNALERSLRNRVNER